MKKQIMPLLLFLGSILFAACGADQNTATTSELKNTEETAIVTNENTETTNNVDIDSPDNSSVIADNSAVTEESTRPIADNTVATGKTVVKNTTKNQPTATSKTGNINTTTTIEATTEPTTTTEPKLEETTHKTTATSTTKTETKPAKTALSHDSFDGLLQKYVNSAGRVNYGGFKNEKAKLVAYIEHLGDNPPESSWSKNKEMAFWINLYNAFTIKLILDKYPIKSIMDLNGGKVWDTQKVNIGGKNYTLGQIEADQLLKRFKEPRVHFAVNCAAASCPPLLNKAWEEDNIQRYYEKQAKLFVNNSSYNTLSAKSAELSQIFNWYASDFGGASNVLKYVQKYSETTLKDKAKVSYREYDWKLNKQ